MHWLVEVSRVGDTVASERYCIDARRWQSALQEARRMRGDAGALPKLTIELTDSGYRAIDPQLKVRYVVSEAPPGTPLTDGARAVHSTAPPPVVESVVPRSPSAEQPPPSLAAIPIPPPPAFNPPPEPPAQVPRVAPTPSTAPMPPASPSAGSEWPNIEVSRSVVSDLPSDIPGPSVSPSVPGPSAPPPPPRLSTQVIRQREERPSEANPLAYRELALAVKAGASRADVEALLLAKLAEERAALSDDTRRYVQLAVFDHVFVKRPVRPPLGTLQWKDWRGEPILAFPGFGDGSEAPPPSSVSTSRMPSWSPGMMTSVAPLASGSMLPAMNHASVHPSAHPPAPKAESLRPLPAADSVPPAPAPSPRASSPPVAAAMVAAPRPDSVVPARVVSIGPSAPVAASPSAAPAAFVAAAPAPAPVVAEPPPAPVPVEDAPIALTQVRPPTDLMAAEAARVAEAVRAAEPAPEPETVEAHDIQPAPPPAARRSDPALRRRSDPFAARRRSPGEDLIGDLFERMHELAFMPDIVSGSDFVIRVLDDLIPCEAALVHVFDLGRREFVVVRARGPGSSDALMYRTPDTDPLVNEVMRRPNVASNGGAPKHSGAFGPLGVEPLQVLARGVRQGGRYLGLIELGNPAGGTPFHEGEVNALEYVCAQFAEFVASRPVVLDEDIVRG